MTERQHVILSDTEKQGDGTLDGTNGDENVEYLMSELRLALMYAKSAQSTLDPEESRRDRNAAQKFFDTAKRLVSELKLSREDNERALMLLEEVKSRLQPQ